MVPATRKQTEREGGKKGPQTTLRATVNLSLGILEEDQKHAKLLFQFLQEPYRAPFH